ncbi:MAG TPA: hypothetical protein VKY22_20880 [Bradyrhizobium sp.]|nr:hypothetical protein [Bradyrhizobium sp.]
MHVKSLVSEFGRRGKRLYRVLAFDGVALLKNWERRRRIRPARRADDLGGVTLGMGIA